MQKPPLPFFCLAGLALLIAGCSTNHKTSRQRYHETEGTLGDTTARSAFMDRRIAEMTEKGMTKESATAQASREWFSQSASPAQTPTTWERQRRKSQANFEAELEKQKKEREAGMR